VLRLRAFEEAGARDRIPYADVPITAASSSRV
jgi:hypothetical protein